MLGTSGFKNNEMKTELMICFLSNKLLNISLQDFWINVLSLVISLDSFHIWATSWKILFMSYVNNKGADQPAHPRSPISTFVVRCLDSIISPVSFFAISWHSLSESFVCVTEQAGLIYPGRKPWRQVFSWRGSYINQQGLESIFNKIPYGKA